MPENADNAKVYMSRGCVTVKLTRCVMVFARARLLSRCKRSSWNRLHMTSDSSKSYATRCKFATIADAGMDVINRLLDVSLGDHFRLAGKFSRHCWISSRKRSV